MTAAGDLVAAARRHLYGGGRPALNTLAAPVSNTDTTIPFTYTLKGVSEGSYLSVGLEVMYVWTVDQTAKTALVQRAQQGSTAAAHSAGDLVTTNPRFSDWDIFTAINDDLTDLSGLGLYQIRTIDLTALSGVIAYDLPTTGFLSLAEVSWQVPGTVTHEWRNLTTRLEQGLPASAFASGQALFIDGQLPTAQQTIRVRYRAALGQFTTLTDDLTTVGLPASAADLPPLGAAVRLMAGQPVPRSNTMSQGDTRRADEVRVGELVQAPAALRALRAERLSVELQRLSALWPTVSHRVTL